jgi:hypothetical protein
MMTTIETLSIDPMKYVSEHIQDFRPIAYYDKHLDCIRVRLKDCSAMETRKNRIFTVLACNSGDIGSFAGCNIKGVRFLFEKIGLEMKGVVALTTLLNAIVSCYPEESIAVTVGKILNGLRQHDQQLGVNFAAA